MEHLKTLGKPVVLCGDMNCTISALDLYDAKFKQKGVAGYTKEERFQFS
jgi:exonuclease III